MGFYLNAPDIPTFGKAEALVNKYQASILPDGIDEFEFDTLRDDEVLVCVVSNSVFEAAGIAYDEAEMDVFKYPDGRKKKWLIMDKMKAIGLLESSEVESFYKASKK